ncbi:MAG: hypothetical protein AB1730_20215 [Myxococcota bacterium]|jgi:hypothetical protein
MNDARSPADTLAGVVLCQGGGDRLAVLAGDVVGVERPSGEAPHAGGLFGGAASAPADAHLLRHETAALVVGALEVHGERLRLLPVPRVLAGLVGGALRGFVVVAGGLWPVVSLPALDGLLRAPEAEAVRGPAIASRGRSLTALSAAALFIGIVIAVAAVSVALTFPEGTRSSFWGLPGVTAVVFEVAGDELE